MEFLKRWYVGFAVAVVSLYLGVAQVFAQAVPNFPVDSAAITNVKSDISGWGAALIGIALAILAFKIVRRVIR